MAKSALSQLIMAKSVLQPPDHLITSLKHKPTRFLKVIWRSWRLQENQPTADLT